MGYFERCSGGLALAFCSLPLLAAALTCARAPSPVPLAPPALQASTAEASNSGLRSKQPAPMVAGPSPNELRARYLRLRDALKPHPESRCVVDDTPTPTVAVEFDAGRAEPSAQGDLVIRYVVDAAKRFPAFEPIEVQGFPDRPARTAADRNLALRRARAVKDRLVAQGVPADRLKAVAVDRACPDVEAMGSPYRTVRFHVARRDGVSTPGSCPSANTPPPNCGLLKRIPKARAHPGGSITAMWSHSKGRSCWAAREREIHIATLHTREAEICNARGYAPDIARAALATVVPLLALAAVQPDGSQEQRDYLQRALDRALWGAELVQREKLGQEASPVLVSAWVAAGDWDRAIAECELVDLDTDSCATAFYLRFAAQHRPEDRAKLVAALESRRPVAKTRESKVGCLPSDASDAFRIALLADLAGDPDLARSQLAWMLMQCEPGAITPGMLDVFPTKGLWDQGGHLGAERPWGSPAPSPQGRHSSGGPQFGRTTPFMTPR